jgi:DNA-binding transcriptional MerR regulator
MGKYSIKDIETLTGVQAHTIRIWEQRYGLIEPHRTDTNIRYYTDDQLKYILNIAFLNHKGMKISKLASMKHEDINNEIEKLYDTVNSEDANIHGLQSAMIDFNKVKFEKIFSNCILKHGVLKTMSDIIIPFMQKIGAMWVTGSVNPAQEHFITNLIRKKILVAIDGIIPEKNPNSKRFILYLPEGEFHEIPLLMAYYILKSQHHDALYMGASLPLIDLKSAINFVEPDIVLTMITIPMQDFTMDEYFNIICSSFKKQTIWASGNQINQLRQKQSNLLKIVEFQDLIDQATKLNN